MAGSLFSIPIFFIVFRETLEAAIIVSVLLGLVEQIARPNADTEGLFVSDWKHPNHPEHAAYLQDRKEKEERAGESSSLPELVQEVNSEVAAKQLIRKLRLQVISVRCFFL